MGYETIEYEEKEKGIGVLSLNRPRKFNAVSLKMMEELEAFLRERQYDLDTHVLILRGNGKRGFCAGLDMKENMKLIPQMTIDQIYSMQARLGPRAAIVRCMPNTPALLGCGASGLFANDNCSAQQREYARRQAIRLVRITRRSGRSGIYWMWRSEQASV